MRYRFYREHKYLISEASDLEKYIAKINFGDNNHLELLRERLHVFSDLMTAHAEHEDKMIHPLLKNKNPKLYDAIETEHEKIFGLLSNLNVLLENIFSNNQYEEKINQGYQFYLLFREFACMNLMHLNNEETVIMSEIHNYYSDLELKQLVDFKVYQQMTSEQMVAMCQILFIHMNIQDKEAFLKDIQESREDIFDHVWSGVSKFICIDERKMLSKKLMFSEI